MSWLPSSAQVNDTVPAPKTSAPLGARYSVMACVAGADENELPWSSSTFGGVYVLDDRSIRPAGRDPLSWSIFHSYPRTHEQPAVMVAVPPTGSDATPVFRQNRT